MISQTLRDIAAGSTDATPDTGSSFITAVASLPAQLITMAANLFGAIGS